MAAKHLIESDEIAANKEQEKLVNSLGMKFYGFDEVLKPIAAQSNRQKMERTMVGRIKTKRGLIKAVHRIFSAETASVIEQRGKLHPAEISAILADQSNRNKNRTQAATKARRNSVK